MFTNQSWFNHKPFINYSYLSQCFLLNPEFGGGGVYMCVFGTIFLLKNKNEVHMAKLAKVFMLHNFAMGRVPQIF